MAQQVNVLPTQAWPPDLNLQNPQKDERATLTRLSSDLYTLAIARAHHEQSKYGSAKAGA